MKRPIVINLCLILIGFFFLSSCTYFKGSKKEDKGGQGAKTAETSGRTDQEPSEAGRQPQEKKNPSPAKEPPKAKLVPDSAVIDMTEAEVKKKFGEPDVVSKMPDSRILWTYQPKWKLIPDNKGTVYIEFEKGKVVKIIRAR